MANKIIFGADLIKVLEKEYKLNKLGEVPTKYKNGVTTIDFIYGKEKDIDDLKYNKPYVEFSIDDETDGFISGTMYLNGGVEGIQFDSWEDLKYFMKNAKWTESKKSIKERYEYKVDEITDIIRSNGVLFTSCNILDDYAWNIEHGKTTWLSKHAYDEISIAYANCIQYLKDEYNGKKKDELIDDLTKFFDKVISLTESKESARKSMKESKVDFQTVIDKVIPKEYAKNKNAYKYALSCVESLYNEDEYDSDGAKVYFLNCYISDSFPSWVDELGEEEMDALANALYDGTMKWSDIDSSWLE